MSLLLSDVLIAEAHINLNHLPHDTAREKAAGYYRSIFQNHDVTAHQFYESLKYYTSVPGLLDEKLQPLIDSMSTLEAGYP